MGNDLILAIDNSLEYLCIAICKGEEIVEERKIKGRESPSQIIGEELVESLEKRALKPRDLSVMVCTTGPGSFTGIRVALSFLKGIKMALGTPLVGVPTLDCLAYPLSFMQGFHILPTIDAKKGEIFCALYNADGARVVRLTPYEAKKPQQVLKMIKKPCVILGSGVNLMAEYVKEEGLIIASTLFQHVPMLALIKLGLERLNRKEENVLPIYGRRSEAEIKFNVRLT